jgi:tRNA G10  N-methylase Trm11
MYLLVLGREKELSKAEVEIVFDDFKVINDDCVTVLVKDSTNFADLGGVIKAAEVFCENSTNPIKDIYELISAVRPNGKINFGLSFYGKAYDAGMGIRLKKSLKSSGRSVRYLAPKQGQFLNAATVIYNNLTKSGFEIILCKKPNGKYLLAKTVAVQDINAYSKRDYDKPCRNTKVGMLPPKLSQTLINLSATPHSASIIDPFCGSGGLLMEAALMGYNSSGSDISNTMVECAQKNVDWLYGYNKGIPRPNILPARDATTSIVDEVGYSVVTEGYLGNNFLSKPGLGAVESQIPALEKIYIDFLSNLKKQKTKPIAVVICLPFWELNGQTVDLNIIDEVLKLGYTIHEFKSVDGMQLRYKREGQFTGRRIFVLN